MQYRKFGRLDWQVSRLGLGSAGLATRYGFLFPGELPVPDRREALRLLDAALDAGINFIDTSPTYGDAERLIGEALRGRRHRVYVATKVWPDPPSLPRQIDDRLRALSADCLDLVQLYNATAGQLEAGTGLEELVRARDQGKLRAIGVTVYELEAARRAASLQEVAAIQLPFNLLDRRMEPFLGGLDAGSTAVVGRSALLKGVLGPRARVLPPDLAWLREAVEGLEARLTRQGSTLLEAALSYVLCHPAFSTVLVGVRSEGELLQALAVERRPGKARIAGRLDPLPPLEPELLDPRRWRGS
jgi:aryl-alcohol dehydrogenase-like predicted oxidoreductase